MFEITTLVTVGQFKLKGQKMSGFKKTTWIIGGVTVALIATGALAAKNRFDSGDRAAFITDRVAERLDLNDAQKVAFEKLVDTRSDLKGNSPAFMLQLKDQLKELAADETLTVEEVNTLRTQIKAEFDRRTDVMIPEFVNFYNTLDSEQRDEVVANIGKIGGRFGAMGGMGGMGGYKMRGQPGGQYGEHQGKHHGEHDGEHGEHHQHGGDQHRR